MDSTQISTGMDDRSAVGRGSRSALTAEHPADRWLTSIENALRTLAVTPHPIRENPGRDVAEGALSTEDKRHSGALMRVNHVGEVCAQALYQAQGLTARSPQLRQQMRQAASEETDHLAWTAQRLQELGSRASLLNPLWYAGAFGLGLLAGRLGDRLSLGFVVETERQVEAHLASHLQRLPPQDLKSRAIVAEMQDDERRHAEEAVSAGGLELPGPARWLMKAAAKVMTVTAHRI